MHETLDVATVNQVVADSFPSAYADGFRCEKIEDKSALARWFYRDDRLRPGAYIPGPVMFGLADVALWMAVFTVVGVEVMAVTPSLHGVKDGRSRAIRPHQPFSIVNRDPKGHLGLP